MPLVWKRKGKINTVSYNSNRKKRCSNLSSLKHSDRSTIFVFIKAHYEIHSNNKYEIIPVYHSITLFLRDKRNFSLFFVLFHFSICLKKKKGSFDLPATRKPNCQSTWTTFIGLMLGLFYSISLLFLDAGRKKNFCIKISDFLSPAVYAKVFLRQSHCFNQIWLILYCSFIYFFLKQAVSTSHSNMLRVLKLFETEREKNIILAINLHRLYLTKLQQTTKNISKFSLNIRVENNNNI